MFPNAHIKTAGIEFVEFLVASSDAACGKERGHGIVDGFLYGRERRMCLVGTSKGVARVDIQFFLNDFQIVVGNDDVGIKDDEVLALTAFGTVVTRKAWT